MRAGEGEEALRVDGREVHAAVTADLAETTMPERSVKPDAFGKVLDVRHVLDRVVPLGLLVFEVVHVRARELHPNAKLAFRRRGFGTFLSFSGRNERRKNGPLSLEGDERLGREIDVDPALVWS